MFTRSNTTRAESLIRELSPCFQAISGLDHLPQTTFRQLLDRHAQGLAAAGMDPADIHGWQRLWDDRERLPDDLVDAIHRIHDMSDEAGHDQLISAAGGPLFFADGGLVAPVTLAAQTLLQRPELFNKAHGRRFVEASRKFRVFTGRVALDAAIAPQATAMTERRFSEHFERRRRAPWCRIRAWRDAGRLHFLVSHGRPARSDDAIYRAHTGWEGTTVHWLPQQHDLVVYDPRDGRLRVSAPDAATMEEYLGGFGELLFGDVGWFERGAVVSLEPLVQLRAESLRPTRGLLEIRLVELVVEKLDENESVVVAKGNNVFAILDELRLDPAAYGPMRTAKFQLRFRSDGRRRTVTVGVPDRITGDWRRDDGAVRTWLEERGFLAGPPTVPATEVA